MSEASSAAPPSLPICEKIVFHKTGLWCQKGWGLRSYRFRGGRIEDIFAIESPQPDGLTEWSLEAGKVLERKDRPSLSFQ